MNENDGVPQEKRTLKNAHQTLRNEINRLKVTADFSYLVLNKLKNLDDSERNETMSSAEPASAPPTIVDLFYYNSEDIAKHSAMIMKNLEEMMNMIE